MKIAAKEADEVEFYIDICNQSEVVPDCMELSEKIQSICKVLNKIISSSKQANSVSNNQLIS